MQHLLLLMPHAFFLILLVQLFIGQVECGYGPRADLVKSFEAIEFLDGVADGDRLLRRDSRDGLSDRIMLEFEGMGRRFGILLEPHDTLLQPDSVVRVHENGSVRVEQVGGRAYVGRQIIVVEYEKEPKPVVPLVRMMKNKLSSFSKMRGDDEDDRPFAHFYLEKATDGRLMAQGGFVHDGHFYQVNHANHPAKMKPELCLADGAEDQLVVSMQPVTEMHGFGVDQSNNGTVTRRFKCGHESKPWNIAVENGAAAYFTSLAQQRKNVTSLLESRLFPRGFETGCPLNRKTLLVGIVADCNYVQAFQGNRGKIQTALINEFSLVSGIYEKSFNINIGIMSIDLMTDCDGDPTSWNAQCRPMHMLGEQMSKFSKYREKLRKDVGVFHLVTNCLHTEVVGIAWLNQVCRTDTFTSGKDFVSGTSASTLIKNHFSVIAHELAHNLGAVHDCNKDLCATCDVSKGNCDCCPCGSKCDCLDKFIMSPGSGTIDVREFSPCSLRQVCGKIPILATCLVDPGSRNTLKLGQCGNGIREDDEECDCGSPEQCAKDPCCMEGCKLRSGATCSDSNDPCCRSCKIIPASERHVCSKSSGFCQFSSYCSGERECPAMKIRPNGTPCKEIEGGKCSAGVCTSRDAQCQAIGGQLGVKKACDTTFNGCDLVCMGPSNTCISFKSTFSDGVPCGKNGFCKSGVCSESIVVTAISKYWVAFVLVAVLFFAAILSCILASCR